MVPQTVDMILTFVVLSFWFLFPIGMFLSVSHLDKITDQIIRLDHLRHESSESERVVAKKESPRIKPQVSNRRPTLIPHH